MSLLSQDQKFMRAATRLSRRHVGLTGSNPCVGAIITRCIRGYSEIIGRGVTGYGGRPHAETIAIDEALSFLKCPNFSNQATLYTTLEPCAHYGKTPPCAEAIIAAKINKVVIAVKDPDPRVAGKGIAMLQDAGIEVCLEIEKDYAAEVLFDYLLQKKFARPSVTLKLAISKDHGLGKKNHANYKISNTLSHAHMHLLRARYDAILVGINTVLIDDPLLTCRLPGLPIKDPVRIVIDKDLKIPITSRLIATAKRYPLWIITQKQNNLEKLKFFQENSVKLINLSAKNGRFDPKQICLKLKDNGINTLFVEGGAHTAESFLKSDLVDRLIVFKSNKDIKNEKITAPNLALIYKTYSKKEKYFYSDNKYEEFQRKLIE